METVDEFESKSDQQGQEKESLADERKVSEGFPKDLIHNRFSWFIRAV
jgi:hypothetical protein